ncbi:MAG: hypothetical protein V4527_12195 [Pseudomonadota bacterium]
MRSIVLSIAAVGLSTSLAFAQGAPAQNGPANPAVKAMDSNNSTTPVAGMNSFTMAQAKSHIEDKGYTDVTNLKKDRDGIWRGMARKDGKSGPVTVDYQGNVN